MLGEGQRLDSSMCILAYTRHECARAHTRTPVHSTFVVIIWEDEDNRERLSFLPLTSPGLLPNVFLAQIRCTGAASSTNHKHTEDYRANTKETGW